MTVIEKKVRRLRWRLEWLNFWRRVVRLSLIALILIALYVLAEKFLPVPWDSSLFASTAVIATIPLALVWALLTRTTTRSAAIVTDEKLSLRERLSTALSIGKPITPMEQAALADAEAHARVIRAHRVFPMPVWRDLYYMPIPILFMAITALLIRPYDLLTRPQKPEKELGTKTQRDLAKRIEEAQKELKNVKKAKEPLQIRELTAEMELLRKDLMAKELTQTDVMKRFSNMADRLADRKTQMEKKIAETQKLERLRSAQQTKKLVDAMARGNFNKAKEELDKLSQKLQDEKLDQNERQQLSKELKALSEALKENSELSKMLAQAAANLSNGQMTAAGEKLQLSGQQMQNLADTLSQMEQLDQLANAMRGLGKPGECECGGKGECEACGQWALSLKLMGEFSTGETEGRGPGMGGPGQGMGGQARFQEGKVGFKPTKPRAKMGKGDIIGMVRVWGPQIKGDSQVDFTDAHFEYSQAAEDTMVKENIPLELREVVRDYFDAIRPATLSSSPDPAEGGENDTGTGSP